ncbi:MAG TPA: Rv3235 family protein [Microlunatus sp.]|nr:Rv3235 family protein [Microlunatus sp.]
MLPFIDHTTGQLESDPTDASRIRLPHGRTEERAGGDSGVEAWSGTLAVAVFEALRGRRPVGQLARWVDDRVTATIAHHRRHAGAPPPGRPAALRSVRVQHPRRGVAEVCAHVAVPGRSAAIALRLETWGDRWLCTAIAFDPREGREPGPPREAG